MFGKWRRGISGGTVRIALALSLVVGACVLFWASRDYAVIAPNWDGQVRGIAYSPSHMFTEKDNEWVTPDQIDRDLAQLSQLTAHIRTYTVSNGMDAVPEIARRYGITVSLGIWIGSDLDKNEKEIDLGIRTALANRRVIDRVFVGSEAILRGDVSSDQLNEYIQRVRAALPNRIEVSTAEPWSAWLLNPEIGQYVDFISMHLFPYWEGIRREIAGERVERGSLEIFYDDVQNEFPDKPIVIGEVGWPSARPRAQRGERIACQRSQHSTATSCSSRSRMATTIISKKPMTSHGRRDRKAMSVRIGACMTPVATRNSSSAAFCDRFPRGADIRSARRCISFLLGLLILGQMRRVHQFGLSRDGRPCRPVSRQRS